MVARGVQIGDFQRKAQPRQDLASEDDGAFHDHIHERVALGERFRDLGGDAVDGALHLGGIGDAFGFGEHAAHGFDFGVHRDVLVTKR